MAKLHNLGFPRIGKKRELKKAVEDFWAGNSDTNTLESCAKTIQLENWQAQDELNLVPVNDFSLYDHILDTSIMLGHIPERFNSAQASFLDDMFRMARGRSKPSSSSATCKALEMTKWFDTNYHYLVPEFTIDTTFKPNLTKLIAEIKLAQSKNIKVKPVLVGPLTYLSIGKEKDTSNRFDLLPELVDVYKNILFELKQLDIDWVQIDEPILVTDLSDSQRSGFKSAYQILCHCGPRILLTSYFGELKDNLSLIQDLPVQGIHIDATRGIADLDSIVKHLSNDQILSVGIIDGRNIWKNNLEQSLTILEPIHSILGDRLWIAPSCSLLHVPVSMASETKLDPSIKDWLAFAEEKIQELVSLGKALNQGRESVAAILAQNQSSIQNRQTSKTVHNPQVKKSLNSITPDMIERQSSYETRASIQSNLLQLPLFPTTTIGSFPQTRELRKLRARYKKGMLKLIDYTIQIKKEISNAVKKQEELGLDVLVHGEAERNDMVEYFGEQLKGIAFTKFGWVQSYGSRCVKPPIIYGDVSRPNPMTVDWTTYAQSLTKKPMKGMLTGPVTILNWSFVRDDQPRSVTCQQLALAIREEVLDLEKAGIKIIQIDEAALREGLPLRTCDWEAYLDWAVESFRLTANGVKDQTQIHTHMCYSEFNDIIQAIAKMDADVITIETSRSQMELLDVFDTFSYPNSIGPGVYDIHSPNIPTVNDMVHLMTLAAEKIPVQQLWVNPDCGLKTRQWDEVLPALNHMQRAAFILRQKVLNHVHS